MGKKHCILDFETLGVADDGMSNQAVVSLAAIVFDEDIGLEQLKQVPFLTLVDKAFYVKFALGSQKPGGKFERKFDPDTIEWWKAQAPEVKKELLPSKDDEQINVAIQKFKTYLQEKGCNPKDTKMYAVGQHFDLPLAQSLTHSCGIDFHDKFCKFWNFRDVRTVLDEHVGMSNSSFKLPPHIEKDFIKHRAEHDVVYTLYQMVYARALSSGEITVQEMYKERLNVNYDKDVCNGV